MISFLAVLFTFSVVVFVHELGHFIVALRSGVDVEVFSLGFGPEIIGYTRKGVRYKISAVPLGGYVKMKGETLEDDDAAEPGSFMGLSPLRRIPILVSGALMNFISGTFIIFLLIYISGMVQVVNEPLIGGLVDGYPAAEAGFLEGDRILAINGTDVTTWDQVVEMVSEKGGVLTEFTVQRDSEILRLEVTPEPDTSTGRGFLGITATVEEIRLGIFRSFYESVRYVAEICVRLVEFLWLMISGRMAAEVSGPIGIAQAVSEAASHGLAQLFRLIALISIQLGFINLFPIPLLDGGHVVFSLIEKVKGSALDPKKVVVANFIGLTMLLALIIFASWQDVARLFK